MQCIIIRGQSTTIVWTRVAVDNKSRAWRCSRDGFQLPAPTTPQQAEQFLLQLAQHSTPITGTIQQVVEVDV